MIKKVFVFILNLIMSILVLGLISVNLVTNTAYNKKYIKDKLKENNFYERTYFDIKDSFENYTIQSGLELTILDDLVSKEKVFNDIDKKIDSIYNGKEVKIESNSIKNELDSRINKVLQEKNKVLLDYEKSAIEKYENAIVDSYESGILYGKYFSANNNYLLLARNIIIIGIVVIGVILIILNRSLLKCISCIGVNLLFSGILCSSIKYLLEKRIIHILILDTKFSNFLVNTLLDIIDKFYKTGIVAILIGILFIIIGSFEKNKKTIENKNN